MLANLDKYDITNLITAFTQNDPNKLLAVLTACSQFDLLANLDKYDITNLITAFTQNDPNKLLAVLTACSQFDLLANLNRYGHWGDSDNNSHEYAAIFKQLIKAKPSTEEWKQFLKITTETGLPVSYYLWQSDLPLYYKELIKIIYPEFTQDMPEGYGMIADDAIYTYYFHKNQPNQKIALLFQGPDFNGAFCTDNVDLWFSKGYNVLSIDARNAAGYKPTISPHPSLESFVEAHQINISDDLEILVINAHGAIDDQVHTIVTLKLENNVVAKESRATHQFVQAIIESLNIQQPISILLTSCYGWHAVPELLNVVPRGSEILALSKHRIINGIESTASTHLGTRKKLNQNLRYYQPTHFDQNLISLKAIAFLHSKSLHDSNKNWKVDESNLGGGTLYAKKLEDSTHQQVIFEDEVQYLSQSCWSEATAREFSEAICFDDACVAEVEREIMSINTESSGSSRFIREAFAGYIALR